MRHCAFFAGLRNLCSAMAVIRRAWCAGLLVAVVAGSAWAGSVTYDYDQLGRIVTATYSVNNVTVKQIQYIYDKAGNRSTYNICDGLCPPG